MSKYIEIKNDIIISVYDTQVEGAILATGDLINSKVGDRVKNGALLPPVGEVDGGVLVTEDLFYAKIGDIIKKGKVVPSPDDLVQLETFKWLNAYQSYQELKDCRNKRVAYITTQNNAGIKTPKSNIELEKLRLEMKLAWEELIKTTPAGYSVYTGNKV